MAAAQVKIATRFCWTKPAKKVYLVGSFADWKEKIEMQFNGKEFVTEMDLSPGAYFYKFVVDGEWCCWEEGPKTTDLAGNCNNCNAVYPHSVEEAAPPRSGSTSPRDKPLKNQFLLPGVRGGCEVDDKKADRRLFISMVGLPARGKSFVSCKLARYLRWLGYRCKVFNLGNYRRKTLGANQSHDFFRFDNAEGLQARNRIAEVALDDVFLWFKEGGTVAIFDATNTTRERRQLIIDRIKHERHSASQLKVKLIFIEIICNDPALIESNIFSTKIHSADYVGKDPEEIVKDFRERIKHYEQAYQTIVNDELSYIKILEAGRKVIANRIFGYLPSRILFFLNNLHIVPRPVYLTVHGENTFDREQKVGGDSELTERGEKFALKLAEFMQKEVPPKDLVVWCSLMKSDIGTAKHLRCSQYVTWKALEEIHYGKCDGLTYEELKKVQPEENGHGSRLSFRYTRGESYEDVVRRLEALLIELERNRKPVVIISHRAILQCILAYFLDVPQHEIPSLDVPLETVIKLQLQAYGMEQTKTHLMADLPPITSVV